MRAGLTSERMSGLQKAAAVMMFLGRDGGRPIWSALTADEVRALAGAMMELGTIDAATAATVVGEFCTELDFASNIHGSATTTELLLTEIFPDDRVRDLMRDVATNDESQPIWERVSKIPDAHLANWMANEQPQASAVILGRLKPDRCAAVLSLMPEREATRVIACMLGMEPISRDAMHYVEKTLQSEFITGQSRQQARDPHGVLAEVFNALDRTDEKRLMAALDSKVPESAQRIRSLMFTFEDLRNLGPEALRALVTKSDKKKLAVALKGASEDVRDLFLSTLAKRAAEVIREDLITMGPRRMREVQDAQADLVKLAKQMADDGEITLTDPRTDGEMID